VTLGGRGAHVTAGKTRCDAKDSGPCSWNLHTGMFRSKKASGVKMSSPAERVLNDVEPLAQALGGLEVLGVVRAVSSCRSSSRRSLDVRDRPKDGTEGTGIPHRSDTPSSAERAWAILPTLHFGRARPGRRLR
jgi:hypothetical protein